METSKKGDRKVRHWVFRGSSTSPFTFLMPVGCSVHNSGQRLERFIDRHGEKTKPGHCPMCRTGSRWQRLPGILSCLLGKTFRWKHNHRLVVASVNTNTPIRYTFSFFFFQITTSLSQLFQHQPQSFLLMSTLETISYLEALASNKVSSSTFFLICEKSPCFSVGFYIISRWLQSSSVFFPRSCIGGALILFCSGIVYTHLHPPPPYTHTHTHTHTHRQSKWSWISLLLYCPSPDRPTAIKCTCLDDTHTHCILYQLRCSPLYLDVVDIFVYICVSLELKCSVHGGTWQWGYTSALHWSILYIFIHFHLSEQ